MSYVVHIYVLLVCVCRRGEDEKKKWKILPAFCSLFLPVLLSSMSGAHSKGERERNKSYFETLVISFSV